MDQVEQCQSCVRNDGVLEDVCDGALFKDHTLFSNDPFALQIIAFFMNWNFATPWGHMLRNIIIMLFTLGNIHPKYRSSLKLIHLLIAATVPTVEKHGIDVILQPLVHDLKVLTEDGICVSVNGVEKVFRGGLLLFLGDNLGSSGFKQSFSFSLRFCRTCCDEYKSLFANPSQLQLRCDEKHIHECNLIDGLGWHYSKTYGINRRSALLDIPLFSMFNGGLAHDVMHDILEGVASLEVSLVLHHCKKYITPNITKGR